MFVSFALCLVFLLSFSDGFFIPGSFRKQAPQTTFNSPQWIPTPITGTNNAANTIPTGYGNPKDFTSYQQPQQQQQIYVQPTGQKYEPSVNHPQYAYEGVYPAPLNTYSQSVQLVPCLCPVNKEVLEQQNQQQTVTPTSSFPVETNNAAAPPTQLTQKKTS